MMRDEMLRAHARDLSTRDELLSLLKQKVESIKSSSPVSVEMKGKEGGGGVLRGGSAFTT